MYLYIWNKNSYSFDQNTVIDKIDPEIVLNVMPGNLKLRDNAHKYREINKI